MKKEEDYKTPDLEEFFDFLILKTKEVIKKLEEGTYNDYIKERLPYNLRYGLIKRQDYWDIYPEEKEELFEGISKEEVDYFIENVTDKTSDRLPKMNARMYYDYCKMVYEAMNYKYEDIDARELFNKNSDGRDYGLRDIDLDSYEEFDEWNTSTHDGHAWEIIPGPSMARIHLFTRKDDKGYYLSTSADPNDYAKEILKLSNVLYKHNIPLQVWGVDMLKNKFLGTDYIRILPEYEWLYFRVGKVNGIKILDRCHFNEENIKIKSKVIWDEIEDISLKK